MQAKVSDLIAEFLADKGITHVFGIIGSGNAHLFDSIAKLGKTEIICVHHEQAAMMAMGTYFRTSGKLSACLVTTGAGSANAVTGVVSCWMDSVPGIVISGNENSRFTQPENPLRIWGIQGYDSTEMVKKVTKHAERVFDPNDILAALENAHATALSGRPGPVWLDVPMNIQSAMVEREKLSPLRSAPPSFTIDNESVDAKVRKTLEALRGAKRPLLWLGNGIRLAGGSSLVEPLLAKAKIPALVSWAGIDLVSSDHPLVYGRAGVYGQRCGNFVLQNCDFLLTIGTRLAVPQVGYDLAEFARDAKEIHCVEIDPTEANKHPSRVTQPIVCDAKVFLEKLLLALQTEALPVYGAWISQCDQYRQDFPWVGPEHADREGFINSYPFMDRLNHYLKKDQVIVTDMGTALLSGHQVLKLKTGQRLMTSTGLGEMGYGLPAAIGVSIARDRGEVICLNCDGGMMMNLQELQTMVHYELPIKLFIFNNDGYLMIKHTQKALFQGRYAGTDRKSGVSCPDYTALAKAFNIRSFQIRTWDDVERVLPEVQESHQPVICEVFMHPEQLLVPKLSLAPQKDGSIISPPLEDLAPFLPREVMRKNMIIGLHPKSEQIKN